MGPSPSKQDTTPSLHPPLPQTKSPSTKTTAPSTQSQQQQQQPSTVAVRKRQVQNSKSNSTDMAILELKLQRERLKKTTDKYYNLAEKMKNAAVEAMQQDPERNKANAIYLIKRSKQYEQQIQTTANQLLNLETSINAIEDGIMQVQIMQALDSGAKVLDSINQELSKADEVMESVREAVAKQREISEILSASIDPTGCCSVADDEDELEQELNKIMGADVVVAAATKRQKQETELIVDNLADQVIVPSHVLPVQQQQNQHQLVTEKRQVAVEDEQHNEGKIAA